MGSIVNFRPRALADAVAPPPPARAEAQWRLVERGLDRRRRNRAARGIGVLAAAVAVTTVVATRGLERWWVGQPVPNRPQLAAPVAPPAGPGSPDAERELRLDDGSRARVAAGGRVRLVRANPTSVQLQLLSGSASFDVARAPTGRRFVVEAEGVSVEVVGARFDVRIDRASGAVDVTVAEGRARVVGAAGARELGAGERWSSATPEPRPRRAPPAPRPTAQQLFDDASHARADGDARRAAALFGELARHHTDHRELAGLSAFELGRLRLDVLDDPAGAADAFRAALRLSAHGMREDIEARLVAALERSGAAGDCRAARARYLAEHPGGIHAAEVRRRCSAP